MWVHDLADADARCGGKAANLARLIAAGLPVPPGFVLDDRAFQHVAGELALDDPEAYGHVLATVLDRIGGSPLPAEVVHDVDARLAAIDAPHGFAVRSSATLEDRAIGAAAGVYSSREAVARAEVWAAIRAVWVSALTPLAVTYARRFGGAIAIGVIVQRFVPGERRTVYTRAPGAPAANEVLVQRDTAIDRLPREADAPAVQLALRAEAAIGATGGADVELVGDAIVQARPIVHPPRRAPRSSAPPTVTALLAADGRRWTWDIAHNPDPLSTAQAELVERVDAAQVAPFSLRVCAGYLYTAPRAGDRPPPPALAELPAIEARLAAIVGPAEAEAVSLDDALARYVAFYAIWAGELSPLVAAHRPATPAARRSVEGLLLATARGELAEAEVVARLGVLAPAWDVAVPTYAERPGLLHDAIARAKQALADGHAARTAPPTGAITAADLGERDDEWFARAQWMVRRALLRRAAELALADGDVFWLPFAALADGITGDDARRRAAASRAAAARAARWNMPVVVGGEAVVGGPTVRDAAPPETRGSLVLHGIGSGGRARGRVVRFATLASTVAVGHGDVVVARAITPALAVMVIGCAALVSETGGFLDHGAAMARELGIPCVVGCRDAWSLLDDGTIVTVDGDAGLVSI